MCTVEWVAHTGRRHRLGTGCRAPGHSPGVEAGAVWTCAARSAQPAPPVVGLSCAPVDPPRLDRMRSSCYCQRPSSWMERGRKGPLCGALHLSRVFL